MIEGDDDAGLTGQLVRAALGYRTATLPEDSRIVARQCILDWFGVTLAGVTEPCAVLLGDELAESSRGSCTVVGRSIRLSAHDAALANGTASHALDFDDVNRRMSGHPTVAVFPAALAIAEERGATGSDLLTAFIAGYEVACMVGAVMSPSHYARGFHATGTIGAIGAAAAAGILLNLDAERMEHALGIAATQAAGLKAMFGSMAKPLHAGRAAANGVFAARLAARGMTARPCAIEADQGFVSTLSDERPRPLWIPDPGSEVINTLFKYHAACYLTHSSIDALEILRDLNGLTPDDVASIDLYVPQGHLAVCNIADPASGLETKFSLRHVAALAMFRRDTSAISTYQDAVSTDPRYAAFRQKVRVHGEMPPGGGIRAVVQTASRTVYEHEHNTSSSVMPLVRQGARIEGKFLSLAAPVIGHDAALRLHAAVKDLERSHTLAPLLASARSNPAAPHRE